MQEPKLGLLHSSEFLKVQEDFNAANQRHKDDQYYNIVERIRDMYHEMGMCMLSASHFLID